MLKICPNCGATVEEDMRFCTTCGAEMNKPEDAPAPAQENVDANPQANAEAQSDAASNTSEPGAKRTVSFEIPDVKGAINKLGKEKVKKYGIIGGIALAAVILLIVIISLASPSGPEAVLKKGIDAAISGNAKQFASVLPPFMFEIDEDMDKDDYIDELEEVFEDAYLDDVEYEIKKVEKLSSSDKRAIKESLEYYEELADDFDADDVTEFKVAKVKFEDGDEDYTKEINLIKYKGKWYIWGFDFF